MIGGYIEEILSLIKEIEKESVTGFLKEYRNYIALLVQEFEMRKNASQYTRSLTAKTGELDTRNLAKYKFTNDIFRKVIS